LTVGKADDRVTSVRAEKDPTMEDYPMVRLLSRRLVLGATAAALPLPGLVRARGDAPEFEMKMGNDNPMSHPNTIRQQEAADRILKETNGRVKISVFPNNQLGGDTDMLSQVRSGALEFMTLSGLILSTFTPLSSIYGIGYAFSGYDKVWAAVDGDLGAMIRASIDKAGLYGFDKVWDNGFRQISSSTHPIRTPQDLKGYKIRVPVSPLWTSMFEAFGAAPASINFSEVYSALQTKIVEGQENPLINIETAKLYEVQKYVSITRHMWDGFIMLGNGRNWKSLPADVRTVIARNLNGSAEDQRKDYADSDGTMHKMLEQQGMTFNEPDPEAFRQTLVKAGFYDKWKDKYGAEAWAVLEKYTGKIGT
jgi:TRAP-type transport system periplasmic protein